MFKKKDKKDKKDKKEKSESHSAISTPSIKRTLLIIDSDSRDWDPVFKDVRLSDGAGLDIYKAEWSNIVLSADGSKPLVNLKPNKRPRPGTNDDQYRTIQPDIVLVRQLVRGLTTDEDYTNVLYGFMFSNTPAVNTFESIWKGLERPVVYAELNKIKNKLGYDKFPLIPMTYYSHQQAMMFTPDLPIVVKVGYAEAGYGKMKFEQQDQLTDFRSVLALHKDYITAERFVTNREYDIRVQNIGTHIRAHRQFRTWAEEVGKAFGMDIFTVDAIHTVDGKDYILEINDTASGLAPSNQVEDMGYIKDLVVAKLEKIFAKNV